MKPNNVAKQGTTRGFSEPLFNIEHDGKVLAVVGANSPEQALGRADAIRYAVPNMPERALLKASFLKSGPICAPFFSANYFRWLDTVDDAVSGDGTCPICGR